MREVPMRCFVGDYDAGDGRRIEFRVWAADHDSAERAVEAIGSTGAIFGELIEEGAGWPAVVFGHA